MDPSFETDNEKAIEKDKLIPLSEATRDIISQSLIKLRSDLVSIISTSSESTPEYLIGEVDVGEKIKTEVKSVIDYLIETLEKFLKDFAEDERFTEYLGKSIAGIGYAAMLSREKLLFSGSPNHTKGENLMARANTFGLSTEDLEAFVLQNDKELKAKIIQICVKYFDIKRLNREIKLVGNNEICDKDLIDLLNSDYTSMQTSFDALFGSLPKGKQRKLAKIVYDYTEQMFRFIRANSYYYVSDLFGNIISTKALIIDFLDQSMPEN